MKKNIVTLLGIAFVVAVIATGVFYGLVVGRVHAAAERPKVAVVVADKAISRGATLERSSVKLVTMEAGQAPAGAIGSVDQAQSMSLAEPLAANEPVLERHLISPRSIPAGMRVVSIRASDSSGVIALLRPGYPVDLQVVGSSANRDIGLKTIVQNVKVMSVVPGTEGRSVVNLVLTPQEADIVGLADSAAKVRLVLRNPDDKGRITPSLVPSSTLFGSAPAADSQ